MRDGILHPEKVDPDALVDMDARTRVNNATGAQTYEYFGNLVDERRERPAEDIITRFVNTEINGERLTRDDPEYRLKPGHEELEYPPGLRHVEDLTLTWK
jgi:cytochrome P450